MASLTVRNLDEAVKARLRIRAATHGRSMEEEVRQILCAAVEQSGADSTLEQVPTGVGLVASIRARFAPLGGWDMPEEPREPMRDPPTFDQ